MSMPSMSTRRLTASPCQSFKGGGETMVFRISCLLLCLSLSVSTLAQTDWHDLFQQWLSAEEMDENSAEDILEQLEDLAATPLNLNQTSREELEQLPFLTERQVENLIVYLDRYRPVRSLSELQMLSDFDEPTRKLLSCFVYVGAEQPVRIWPRLSEMADQSRHTLMATGLIPFFDRRGNHNGYLGYRYRHDLRYQLTYKNQLKLGLTAAQDAGEPFFSGHNRWGYDYYSYYFQLRDIGRLRELNIGMYKVQLGLGLVMNTSFQLGKLAMLQTMGRSTHSLIAHSSRSQADYLQGAAATVQLSNHLHLTAFASWRPLDATLNDNGTARTIITSGYHRTPTEMSKKNNTHQTDLGGSIGWRKGTFHAHAQIVYTHLNRELQPQQVRYQQYAPHGSQFFNASLDYGYRNYRWEVAGETAISQNGALATLHTLSCRVADPWTLFVLHRYYDKRYTSLHARSFSEGGKVQNEHGVYLGAIWKPSVEWQLQGFVDYAHFSWLRYQMSAPSDAFDSMLTARYSHKKWSLGARYRLHIRQRDSQDKKRIINRPEQRIRLVADYSLNNQWTLSTQADGVLSSREGQQSKGMMFTQRTAWHTQFLKADALVGWFCTDNYDSRIYLYERSVRYNFGFPVYYGRGLRASLMLSTHLSKCLQATAKFGFTRYFDRSVIGTGLQQVNHSGLTDLLLQITYHI